ncbi:MAG: hypothetical protein BWY99_02546 [Synergistetes bacterium ADurb.BinA166]|nr:MAG: hypothetical protein BWY99_02546 [Synergistetes bacterium ADurb.BinA166]
MSASTSLSTNGAWLDAHTSMPPSEPKRQIAPCGSIAEWLEIGNSNSPSTVTSALANPSFSSPLRSL